VLSWGYEKPVGEHWHRGIAPDQCLLCGFWPHIRLRTVLTIEPRKMPQSKVGVIRKVARHGRQGRLEPRNRSYFLNCGGGSLISQRDIGMDNSVTGNKDMLDSGYPRRVHDDVGHGCEPGLSATSPCWRLPLVPRYMLPLLSKEAHHQVAWEVLQGFSGGVFRPVVEPAHLSAIAVASLA